MELLLSVISVCSPRQSAPSAIAPLFTAARTARIHCRSGELEAAFKSMGLELKGAPTVELFKDNVALALPAPLAAVPTTAAADSSSGLPLGAIIGIAVGAAVLLAALALVAVVVCKRRRARRSVHTPQRWNGAGGSAHLSVGSGFKGMDKFEVVDCGSNTPTTPMQRRSGAFSS